MTPSLVAGAWVGGEDPSVHFRTLGAGAGGHTALPIVGQFYSQVLSKSKFKNLKYSTFEQPSDESLALLSVLPYREILEVTRKGFFHDLFGRKDQKSDELVKKGNSVQSQKKSEEAESTEPKAKKPFWQSMKEVFKKKSK